jgi:hypothetical protein
MRKAKPKSNKIEQNQKKSNKKIKYKRQNKNFKLIFYKAMIKVF